MVGTAIGAATLRMRLDVFAEYGRTWSDWETKFAFVFEYTHRWNYKLIR